MPTMELDDKEVEIIDAYRLGRKHLGGTVDILLRIRRGVLFSIAETRNWEAGHMNRAPPVLQVSGAGAQEDAV